MATASKLYLSIVSPEKMLFEGEVKSVSLPGAVGAFTILPHHAPIVSSLKAGVVKYVATNNDEQTFEAENGFVEMSGNKVTVCIALKHNGKK
ncbi:ATP synthase F1 subunit epsilon [Bacteroides sp. OttesenSCG-928-N06]|nr:ATP synthase F1 subunit epsilon [Bacteroides sp. OttesenSCG-928-N06]